jgi:hypothetical protein
MGMKSASRKAAFAAAFVCLAAPAAAPAAAQRPPQMVGGYQAVGVGDARVQAAAVFAVKELGGAGARLQSVNAAQRQIVQGTNYKLDLTAADGRRWLVTVYHPLSGEMQVTERQAVPTEGAAQGNAGPRPATTAERRAILAALRPAIVRRARGPIEFVVEKMDVQAGWALAWVQPQRPGGRRIDPASILTKDQLTTTRETRVDALLRRRGDRWEVVRYELGHTDVWYACYRGAPAGLVGDCG